MMIVWRPNEALQLLPYLITLRFLFCYDRKEVLLTSRLELFAYQDWITLWPTLEVVNLKQFVSNQVIATIHVLSFSEFSDRDLESLFLDLLHDSLIHLISIAHSLRHLLKPFQLEVLSTRLGTLLWLGTLLVRIFLR